MTWSYFRRNWNVWQVAYFLHVEWICRQAVVGARWGSPHLAPACLISKHDWTKLSLVCRRESTNKWKANEKQDQHVSPGGILPIPQVIENYSRKTRGRRGKTAILTSTSYEELLQQTMSTLLEKLGLPKKKFTFKKNKDKETTEEEIKTR